MPKGSPGQIKSFEHRMKLSLIKRGVPTNRKASSIQRLAVKLSQQHNHRRFDGIVWIFRKLGRRDVYWEKKA